MVEVSVLKKLLFLMIFAAAVLSAANAQLIVTHEIPAQSGLEQTFSGTVNIAETDQTKFDISLMLPVTWEITDWSVTGNISAVKFEKTTVSYKDKVNEAFHWLFDGPTKNIVLKYTSKPLSTGTHNVTLLWFYEGGFGSKDDSMFISGEKTVVSVCGNKICEGLYGENLFSCPRDCAFKYLENMQVWLTILIIALLTIFIGLGYKIYRAYLRRKAEVTVTPIYPANRTGQPMTKLVLPSQRLVVKPVPTYSTRVVKMKHVKHKVKKHTHTVKHAHKKAKKAVKHIAKKKTAQKGVKRTDFYSKTMKKLESIKKSLK